MNTGLNETSDDATLLDEPLKKIKKGTSYSLKVDDDQLVSNNGDS